MHDERSKQSHRTQHCPVPVSTALGIIAVGHKIRVYEASAHKKSWWEPLENFFFFCLKTCTSQVQRLYGWTPCLSPQMCEFHFQPLSKEDPVLQGACSSFAFVASTQSNFAKEKMYLTYTARYIIVGKNSRETLKPNL